jgi:hypothetical protein
MLTLKLPDDELDQSEVLPGFRAPLRRFFE